MDYYTRRLVCEIKDTEELANAIIKRYQEKKIIMHGKILTIGDELLYIVSSKKPKIIINATVLDIDHIEPLITVKVKDDSGDCILKLKSTKRLLVKK